MNEVRDGFDRETPTSNPSRRDFLKRVGVTAMAAGLPVGAGGWAASQTTVASPQQGQEKPIFIQVSAASLNYEGVDKVLDIVQERAGVNALMLPVFGSDYGFAGGPDSDQPLPDHGPRQSDEGTLHGGDFANIHLQYYSGTILRNFRAPDEGKFDILGDVVPKAKARKMKCYSYFIDEFNPRYIDGFEEVAAEVDIYGRPTGNACLNNPQIRNLFYSLAEDWIKSYDIDGIMWASERLGPLGNAIVAYEDRFNGRAEVTCFCPYCRQKGRDRGIDVERAREGLQTLLRWAEAARSGPRPADGYFVTFWRVLAEYPEILAWEKLWTDNKYEIYSMLYGEAKSIRPDIAVGWHLSHNNSFSPFFRAELDYRKLVGISDFLKVVMYNDCAGPRLANYIRNIHSTIFKDFSPEEVLDIDYKMLGYKGEANLQDIPHVGLSANYVAEETRRALEGVQGQVNIYPGIGIDVPTGPGDKKTTPESARDAVRAALTSGAHGIVLSRRYSEMHLANLSGAGQALKDLGFWKDKRTG
jgi:hypothetical protein